MVHTLLSRSYVLEPEEELELEDDDDELVDDGPVLDAALAFALAAWDDFGLALALVLGAAVDGCASDAALALAFVLGRDFALALATEARSASMMFSSRGMVEAGDANADDVPRRAGVCFGLAAIVGALDSAAEAGEAGTEAAP